MTTEFTIGEIAWHTEWQQPVKIAGPLEIWGKHIAYGQLIDQEVRGHRVVLLNAKGEAAKLRMLAARPISLRKIEQQVKVDWDVCGWRPRCVR